MKKMKSILLSILMILSVSISGQSFTPEIYTQDSLIGFNTNEIIIYAKQNGVNGSELRNYVRQRQRDFISQKYYPKTIPVYTTSPTPTQKPTGGPVVINAAPCVNEGFENTPVGTYNGASNAYAVQGWTLYGEYANSTASAYNCLSAGTPYNLGANEFQIVSTPLTFNGSNCSFILGNSPFGGTRVAKLNSGQSSNYSRNKIAQNFPVTTANALFQFAFAGFYENPGHSCCDQPGLYLRVINACNGNTVASCSSMTLAANCGTLANVSFTPCGANGVMSNWQTRSIDLTPYIGGCVTIEIWTGDCNFGGHWGTTYFDAVCGGQNISPGLGGLPGGPIPGALSFCSGSGVATIAGPLGYNSYQWYGPNGIIPPPTGTLSVLTITNPVQGASYTVNLTSSGGCQLSSITALNTTTVMIAGVGSSTTCLNGSSGSATVQGAGSGSGYSYTWTSSSSSVVGNSSVAVNLPAGIYSVTISGLGNALCGTATATVAVTSGTPTPQKVFKPFCNGQAYLATTGGSNFQWFLGNNAIAAPLGVASSYTVTSPSSGAVYNLTYTSIYNCNEAASFTLVTSAPGAISVLSSSVCPGGTNGTGTINLIPAAGSPPGQNVYSVFNHSNTPSYSTSTNFIGSTSYTFNNLSAGTYSVRVFDGSCLYTTNLITPTHLFSWNITPSVATICQGQQIVSSIVFTTPVTPTQYSYTWTPGTMLTGTSFQNNIITANTPPGTSVQTTYSITVTPTVINCPQTKTMSILVTNPATPIFVPIPNLCDNGAPYVIQVTPQGGSFSIPGGVINPSLSTYSFGVNSVSYTTITNGCSASNSTTFQINRFNSSNLTSSISPLCVTNASINLMTIVQNTTGSWSSGSILTPSLIGAGNHLLTYSTTSFPNPTVCPSSSQLFVSVSTTVVPTLSQPAPFCNNSPTFALTASPSGGVWGSNPAVQTNGIVNPGLSSPQNTLVTYTVVVGPCVNTTTTALYPSSFRQAALTGTIGHQCYNSNLFNLISIVQNTTGVWSGPGVGVNQFSPNLLTGVYTLTYNTTSTPNPTVCPDSKTINVSVLNPPTPSIQYVPTLCSQDQPFQLIVSPVGGIWYQSSCISSSGLFNPSSAAIGSNVVTYAVGTSTCLSQQSAVINVEAFIPSTITKQIPDLCNTSSSILLTPFTQFPGSWSGSGIVGNMFVPLSAGVGTIVLTHNTASFPSGLCPSTSSIAVNVYSLQTPTITKPNSMCNTSMPFQLTVTPVGGLFSGSGALTTLGGVVNPAFGQIGINVVNYSVTVGPCVAYAQTTINIEKFISAEMSAQPKNYYCIDSDNPFNLNSLVSNVGGLWSGSGVVGNMFDPSKALIGSNKITYYTHSIPTTYLCPDSRTISLNVVKPTQPIVSAVTSSKCLPVEVLFSSNTSAGSGTWYFGDGINDPNTLISSHIYTLSGSYVASFSYISPEGCSVPTQTVLVSTMNYQPLADFIVPSATISDSKVTFINTTTKLYDNVYSWSIPSLGVQSNYIHLEVDFPKAGVYKVYLIAESLEGCTSVVNKVIEIKNEFSINVPNSFTPDGDGLNDVFKPIFSDYGLDANFYSLDIYDRWGHLMFSTTEVNKGWDGKVKGEYVKEDTYTYKIRYTDALKRSYNKIGYVILLKN